MVTYYTALGRMITKKNNGSQLLIIVSEDSEFELSADKLIIWRSLRWNFLGKEALEKEYSRRKTNNRIFNDVSLNRTLTERETAA